MSFYHQLRESSQSEELPFGKLSALSDLLSFVLKGKSWSYTSGGDSGEPYCSFTKQKGGKKAEVEAKILNNTQVEVTIWCYRIADNKYVTHQDSPEIIGQPKIKVFTVKDDWKSVDYSWVVEQAEKVAATLNESKIYPELNNIQLEKTSNDFPFEGTVVLKPSPTADTRSADDLVSKEELKKSTEMHISDVQKAAKFLSDNLLSRVKNHDHTKLKYFEEYFKQFRDAQQTGQWSQDHEAWEKKYHLAERHHLKHRAPDDIDLLDVLEMICDSCVAAMARSGKYRDEPFDSLVLKKAYDNTIQKLLKSIEVKQ